MELKPIPGDFREDHWAGDDGNIYHFVNGAMRMRTIGRNATTGKNRQYWGLAMKYRDGRKIRKAVHILVCSAFHGARPTDRHEVRHLDGNGSNNVPTNLKWGTPEENWEDRKRHGRGNRGAQNKTSKLSDTQRDEIISAIVSGYENPYSLSKKYDMDPSSIRTMAELRLGKNLTRFKKRFFSKSHLTEVGVTAPEVSRKPYRPIAEF